MRLSVHFEVPYHICAWCGRMMIPPTSWFPLGIQAENRPPSCCGHALKWTMLPQIIIKPLNKFKTWILVTLSRFPFWIPVPVFIYFPREGEQGQPQDICLFFCIYPSILPLSSSRQDNPSVAGVSWYICIYIFKHWRYCLEEDKKKHKRAEFTLTMLKQFTGSLNPTSSGFLHTESLLSRNVHHNLRQFGRPHTTS